MLAKWLSGLLMTGMVALCAAPAWSQEDLRVRQLENEVSRLQRELDAQSRRIDDLERNSRSVGAVSSPAPPDAVRRSAESSPAWLVSSNWDRVRTGMKELDVIALLGRPTTVRAEPDGKTHALMYALELGPNAVLAGNVRLGDAGVLQVTKPLLRAE
jgi:hypothetical protein